jgi:hypothetical protein
MISTVKLSNFLLLSHHGDALEKSSSNGKRARRTEPSVVAGPSQPKRGRGRPPKAYDGPATKNEKGDWVCNLNGCEHHVQDIRKMIEHQKTNDEYHANLLFVYLRHYLVFEK